MALSAWIFFDAILPAVQARRQWFANRQTGMRSPSSSLAGTSQCPVLCSSMPPCIPPRPDGKRGYAICCITVMPMAEAVSGCKMQSLGHGAEKEALAFLGHPATL